jgi:hypothetical protein
MRLISFQRVSPYRYGTPRANCDIKSRICHVAAIKFEDFRLRDEKVLACRDVVARSNLRSELIILLRIVRVDLQWLRSSLLRRRTAIF